MEEGFTEVSITKENRTVVIAGECGPVLDELMDTFIVPAILGLTYAKDSIAEVMLTWLEDHGYTDKCEGCSDEE